MLLSLDSLQCDDYCQNETLTGDDDSDTTPIFDAFRVVIAVSAFGIAILVNILVYFDTVGIRKLEKAKEVLEHEKHGDVDFANLMRELKHSKELSKQERKKRKRLKKKLSGKKSSKSLLRTSSSMFNLSPKKHSNEDFEVELKRREEALAVLTEKFLPVIRHWQESLAHENSAESPSGRYSAPSTVDFSSCLEACDAHQALSWTDLVFQVKDQNKTKILNGCRGYFRFGRLSAIMGGSGCGKSTLLKLLAGKTYNGAFSGTYQKHSLLSFQRMLTGRDISFVRQFETGALVELTVEENLRYRIKIHSKVFVGSDTKINDDVDDIIKRVGLEHRRNVQVKSLSGGQLKRMGIAMELIMNDVLG